MKPYFEIYSNLSHRRFGQPLDISPIKNDILKFFKDENIHGYKIFLSDEDPFRFALTFLYLIDKKAIPVPVSPGYVGSLSEMHIENLKWKNRPTNSHASNFSDCYLCLSSGTTGQPKPIALSVEKGLKNAKAHAEGFALDSSETLVQTLPIYHSYGIVAYILTPIVKNLSVDFCPNMIGLRSFKSEDQHVIHMSPSQARFILKDKFNTPVGIKKITIGAGALSHQELDDLQIKFPEIRIYVSYGLTEAGPRVTAGLWANEIKSTARRIVYPWIGSSLPGVITSVFDGQKVKNEGKGMLCIKTESLALNIAPEEKTDGWFKTRDEVELINGQVFFISRTDDIIKCGGITIFPAEMENIFRSISGVKDVLVLKKADPIYDEVPVLFIEGTVSGSEIREFTSHTFSPSIAPRNFYILDKFPRQSLNKVDRQELKKMMGEHSK